MLRNCKQMQYVIFKICHRCMTFVNWKMSLHITGNSNSYQKYLEFLQNGDTFNLKPSSQFSFFILYLLDNDLDYR